MVILLVISPQVELDIPRLTLTSEFLATHQPEGKHTQ